MGLLYCRRNDQAQDTPQSFEIHQFYLLLFYFVFPNASSIYYDELLDQPYHKTSFCPPKIYIFYIFRARSCWIRMLFKIIMLMKLYLVLSKNICQKPKETHYFVPEK